MSFSDSVPDTATTSWQAHSSDQQQQQLYHHFLNHKLQCLTKRDKSRAGQIDERAHEICQLLNARDGYYTTSSCSGRCFLYRGCGNKSASFRRYRVCHDRVEDAEQYFDLSTLDDDDETAVETETVIDEEVEAVSTQHHEVEDVHSDHHNTPDTDHEPLSFPTTPLENNNNNNTVWLRFEPFILHVRCRSLSAAAELMAAARPAFKNVGVTSWKHNGGRNNTNTSNSAFFVVAIWGDEGLDLPLSCPDGTDLTMMMKKHWLAELVNERHERNWSKLARFVRAVRDMSIPNDTIDNTTNIDTKYPSSFDVIGDVAVLHSIATNDPNERRDIGQQILRRHRALRVVVVRDAKLLGSARAQTLSLLAGAPRSPLLTTHCEYGIKCVVDVPQTFFSPRMCHERWRLCQQVQPNEHVLVVFAGVAMEALMIAGRTKAESIIAVDANPVAMECAQRGRQLLARNKSVKCAGAIEERLQIIQGDVLEVVPKLLYKHGGFNRIIAPRPKQGDCDGDVGQGDHGLAFLHVLLPALDPHGGICHWYDFVADWELPRCERSQSFLKAACDSYELTMDVMSVNTVGSVAMRQYRVCIDFQVSKLMY